MTAAEEAVLMFELGIRREGERVVEFQDPHERVRPSPRRGLREDAGWVYFIAALGSACIKIGWSRQGGDARLRHLQTGNPHELKIVCRMKGDRGLERKLHARFAAERVRGEWFRESHELLLLMMGLKQREGAVARTP